MAKSSSYKTSGQLEVTKYLLFVCLKTGHLQNGNFLILLANTNRSKTSRYCALAGVAAECLLFDCVRVGVKSRSLPRYCRLGLEKELPQECSANLWHM